MYKIRPEKVIHVLLSRGNITSKKAVCIRLVKKDNSCHSVSRKYSTVLGKLNQNIKRDSSEYRGLSSEKRTLSRNAKQSLFRDFYFSLAYRVLRTLVTRNALESRSKSPRSKSLAIHYTHKKVPVVTVGQKKAISYFDYCKQSLGVILAF